MKALEVRQFEPQSIADDSVCVLIGKRRTGKSTAIADLLYYKRYFGVGQIVSGSEACNPFFSKFFPSAFIDSELKMSMLDQILERQRKVKAKMRDHVGNTLCSKFMLVLDDCLYDATRWAKTPQMRQIFMNGRHYDIFFILAMQYVIGIGPELRSNIDYVFIFRDASIKNRKKLYDNYGAMIPSFKMFCVLMDALDTYECIVINVNGTEFRNSVFYWKPQLREKYRWGTDKFWMQNAKINKHKRSSSSSF